MPVRKGGSNLSADYQLYLSRRQVGASCWSVILATVGALPWSDTWRRSIRRVIPL